MQRRKNLPEFPRFDYVTAKAYEFLLECGYSTFPISPYDVLKELHETVVCLAWSEARKILNTDDPFHLKKLGAEGRTIRVRGSEIYMIVYDDVAINTPERIAWTIMHEIGHVKLNHLTEFADTALNRGGISNEAYGVLEKEAHYFAAEFLMPTAILKYYSSITCDEIALLFGVSDEAAAKKHNRVFRTGYFPQSEYDEKVLRNFLHFLVTGADAAIYHSIYGMWGLPKKAKYESVCRKCQNCLSYIDNPSAEYCVYCGKKIAQHRMYKNMSERLDAKQKFNQSPGVSHIHIQFPYISGKLLAGIHAEKLTICPTCLNHEISDTADYCLVCGQALVNKSLSGKIEQSVADCFNRETGEENLANSWYPVFEKRMSILQLYAGDSIMGDWMEYPYWEYTKLVLRRRGTNTSMDMRSALLYARAFIDDADDIYIITDTGAAAQILNDGQQILLEALVETDDINREKVEVIVPYDL